MKKRKSIKYFASFKTTLILLTLIFVTVYANVESQQVPLVEKEVKLTAQERLTNSLEEISVNELKETKYNYDEFYNKTTNTINLSLMPLKLKIAQMLIVNHLGALQNYYLHENYGGVYIVHKDTKENFQNLIKEYSCEDKLCIPTFTSVDLEGIYSNPFSKIKEFKCVSQLKNSDEAFALGNEQAQLLSEIGIDIIFSPVLDLEDNIWNCRAFQQENIVNIVRSYIKPFKEKGIITVAKHYPGQTLTNNDPHKQLIYKTITKKDIKPFIELKPNVDAIMISHSIVNGTLNSFNKPSTISKPVISKLKNDFDGLIISDEISMNAFTGYYKKNKINHETMYIDLINSGNDMILFFTLDIEKMDEFLTTVENAVADKIVDEDNIDKSVKKILKYKKIKVVK